MALSLGSLKPIPLPVESFGTPGHKTTKPAPHPTQNWLRLENSHIKDSSCIHILNFVVHMSYSIQYTFVIYLFLRYRGFGHIWNIFLPFLRTIFFVIVSKKMNDELAVILSF